VRVNPNRYADPAPKAPSLKINPNDLVTDPGGIRHDSNRRPPVFNVRIPVYYAAPVKRYGRYRR